MKKLKPLAMNLAQAKEMNELQFFSNEDPANAQGSNFYDGMKEMEVLEAGLRSAETGKMVELS